MPVKPAGKFGVWHATLDGGKGCLIDASRVISSSASTDTRADVHAQCDLRKAGWLIIFEQPLDVEDIDSLSRGAHRNNFRNLCETALMQPL